jgi:hypothetical protein
VKASADSVRLLRRADVLACLEPVDLDRSAHSPRSGKPRYSGVSWSAPDRIRTCDLRFRRPRREFGGARLGSGFGSIPGLKREGKVSRVDEYTERAEALEAAGLSE